MALVKMGAAARRAKAGSTSTIQRALRAAGVPLVLISPGTVAVEEEDLNRFLANRSTAKAAEKAAAKASEKEGDEGAEEGAPAAAKPAKKPVKSGKPKMDKSKKRRG